MGLEGRKEGRDWKNCGAEGGKESGRFKMFYARAYACVTSWRIVTFRLNRPRSGLIIHFFFPFSLSSWLILANCIFGFVLLWLFKVRRVGKYTYSFFFFSKRREGCEEEIRIERWENSEDRRIVNKGK